MRWNRMPSAKTGRVKRRTPTTVRVAERDLQKAICDWLEVAGIPYTVTDAALVVAIEEDGTRTARQSSVTKSWPDITGCLPDTGRLLAVEVKAQDGTFRPGQQETLDRLHNAGAVVVVPRTLEELVNAITAFYDVATDDRLANEYFGQIAREMPDQIRRAITAYHQGTGAR